VHAGRCRPGQPACHGTGEGEDRLCDRHVSLYADVEGKNAVTAMQMAIDDFGGKVLASPSNC
jgi:branched-chain amino acid transport system substrate-binding protein